MKKRFTSFCQQITILSIMLLSSAGLFAQSVDANRHLFTGDDWSPKKTVSTDVKQHYVLGDATIDIIVNEYTFPSEISDNGQYIAILGFGESGSLIWSATAGLQTLAGQIYSVTNEGKVGGTYPNPDYLYQGSPQFTGGTWLHSTSAWTFLGVNPAQPEFFGTDYNSAWGMSSDGTVLAGMQWYPNYTVKAFKWTETDGYSMIGNSLPLGSRANGVSSDGSLAFGWAETNSSSRTPVIWTETDVILIDESQYGEAFTSSPNGAYIAGDVGENNFIWNQESGITLFSNTLNSGVMSSIAVANDGTVFGYTNESWPPFPDARRAFARLPDGTMQSFNDYAESRGMADAQDWLFFSANTITPDGNTIVGAATDPQGNWVTFVLTFGSSTTQYNLNLLANPIEGGELTGAGSYEAGTMVTIEAVEAVDFAFINWTDEDGNVISEEASTSIEMPESDLTLIANFTTTVGIAQTELQQSTIYPNPANNRLNLKLRSNSTRAKIFDLSGHLLLEQEFESTSAFVETHALKTGLYMIQLQDEHGIENQRFQVIR